jgi:alcohol dehydrogenase
MIASALGASVVAVDITPEKLDLARSIGAVATVNGAEIENVAAAVVEFSHGGVHVSMDALGSQETCFNSIASLRKRGKHIQVGLMTADHKHPNIPMDRVIANELEIVGSHGMQAYVYEDLLQMIQTGKLQPEKLIGKTVNLEESMLELVTMDSFAGTGVTVINQF